VHADVVTISDEYSSGGEALATEVGKQLSVPVYDREIVTHIAETEHVRVETVELLDQRALNFVDDYLTSFLHERSFDQNDYLHALTHTITALWGHGPCVFVGRSAGRIIPRTHALTVRITAPKQARLQRLQQTRGLDRVAAQRELERKDADREAFIRRMFHANIHDPLGYDLVLNTGELDLTAASAITVHAFRSKFRK
jgi:cytidylate kinase